MKEQNFIVLTLEKYIDDELDSFEIIETFTWNDLQKAAKKAMDVADTLVSVMSAQSKVPLVKKSECMKYMIMKKGDCENRIEVVKHFEKVSA